MISPEDGMAKKQSAGQLREVRIELLRARAAIQRQALSNNVRSLGNDLTPSALLKGLLPGSVGRKRPADWVGEGLGLLRRYPFILSTASALFSGARKRHRLVRLGAGLLLTWQVARSMSGRNEKDVQAGR